MLKTTWLSIVLALTVHGLAGCGSVPDESDETALAASERDTEKQGQVKEVIDGFRAALLAKNADEIMKHVDVPFATWEEPERKHRVIDDRRELRDYMRDGLRPGPPADVWLHVGLILTPAEFLAKFGEQLKPADRQLMERVLQPDDRVAGVRAQSAQGESSIVFLVGWRGGRAKLVGSVDFAWDAPAVPKES